MCGVRESFDLYHILSQNKTVVLFLTFYFHNFQRWHWVRKTTFCNIYCTSCYIYRTGFRSHGPGPHIFEVSRQPEPCGWQPYSHLRGHVDV